MAWLKRRWMLSFSSFMTSSRGGKHHMPFFNADSITFHYLDVGQGRPFVFQHGTGGDVHQAQDLLVPPLPFRLLTLDCRGHGETGPIGDPAYLNFASFADDLLTLLDVLHLQQVVVGGISMGA